MKISVDKKDTVVTLTALLVILAVYSPVVWYSVLCPLGLIDDLGKSINFYLNYERSSSLSEMLFLESDRYRPFYLYYQILTFKLFALNGYAHHLLRFLIKGLILFITYRFFRKAVPNRTALPFLVFVIIYLFTPNNPEVRLGPSEPLVVLFLSVILNYIALILFKHERKADCLRKRDYLAFISAFTLMLMSKESAIALGVVVIFVMVMFDYGTMRKRIAFNVPLILIGLTILFKISLVMIYEPDHYAHDLTIDKKFLYVFVFSVLHVFNLNASYALLLFSSLSLPFFIMNAFNRLGKGVYFNGQGSRKVIKADMLLRVFRDNDLYLLAILLLLFIAYIFIVSLSGVYAIRYFYPLVYIFAVAMGFMVKGLNETSHKKRVVLIVTSVAFLIYFSLVNYYNVLYQPASQYSLRTVESHLLKDVKDLMEKEKVVYLNINKDEFTYSINNYFERVLPFYTGEKYSFLRNTSNYDYSKEDVYFISRDVMTRSNHEISRKYFGPVPAIAEVAKKISYYAQFMNRPLVVADAGARVEYMNSVLNQNMPVSLQYSNPWFIHYSPNDIL